MARASSSGVREENPAAYFKGMLLLLSKDERFESEISQTTDFDSASEILSGSDLVKNNPDTSVYPSAKGNQAIPKAGREVPRTSETWL
jgi:hypothetical protein